MTYQLPEPALPNCVIGKDSTMRPIHLDCYTAEQMQAAYQAGRDSMKAEVLLKLDLMLDYCGGLVSQILTEQIKQIKELK